MMTLRIVRHGSCPTGNGGKAVGFVSQIVFMSTAKEEHRFAIGDIDYFPGLFGNPGPARKNTENQCLKVSKVGVVSGYCHDRLLGFDHVSISKRENFYARLCAPK
jgi:hypothetical protein